jgi:hypothetical protein
MTSSAPELLANPDALLNRGHLRELGFERRAVDAVFRACPIVALPGYSRPLIRVRDYLALLGAIDLRRPHRCPGLRQLA